MIWVIAGTLDGRRLAVEVQKQTGLPVLVTVVSQYGAQLAQQPGIEVHTGRLDKAAMEVMIKEKKISLLIDASHPYAAVVTKTAYEAATACAIPFIRFERPEVPLPAYDKLHHTADETQAAALAGELGERIFLTTGSKTMRVFAEAPALQNRTVWTRVLPTAQVLSEMEALGVSPKHIIAMQGPFSHAMNKTMFADTQAQVVVMKNSGLVGGSDTKLAAAMELGLHIIVIDRPRLPEGLTMMAKAEDFINLWEELQDGLRKKSKGD